MTQPGKRTRLAVARGVHYWEKVHSFATSKVFHSLTLFTRRNLACLDFVLDMQLMNVRAFQ